MKRQITVINSVSSEEKTQINYLSPCKGNDTLVSINGSSSKKRKKTPQEKLEEIERRKERELKKLSDCWSMNNTAFAGPRSRRSSIDGSPRVKPDFINYDNDNGCFDSLVTPLSISDKKSGSSRPSHTHKRAKSATVSFQGCNNKEKLIISLKTDNAKNQDAKNLPRNNQNQPNCKRELTFSLSEKKQVSDKSDLHPIKLKIYKESPEKKKCDCEEQRQIGQRARSKVEISVLEKFSNELDTERIKEFLQINRKKLRSEVSDKELWEGFPVDLKLPRLKSKLIQGRNIKPTVDETIEPSVDSDSMTVIGESSKTCDMFKHKSVNIKYKERTNNMISKTGSFHVTNNYLGGSEKSKDNKPVNSAGGKLNCTHLDNNSCEDQKHIKPCTKQGIQSEGSNCTPEKKTVSFTPVKTVSPAHNKVFTRLKAKTPEKYGFVASSKSELFKKLPEPSPRTKKPAHIELLDDMRLAKSACTLWVSEGRRRFQQENPNATSKQLDGLMRTAWDKLAVRQKLVYFVRAKSALDDKLTCKVAQAKKKSQKKEKPIDVPIEFFQELPGSEQDAILKRRLAKIQADVSRSQYTAFLNTFYQNYKEEKLHHGLDDSNHSLARQVLFKWICKAEGSIMDMKLERIVHYRNQLLQQYNSLVENMLLSECSSDTEDTTDSQSKVYDGGDHLSHSEQLCDILQGLQNHTDQQKSNDIDPNIKKDPAFRKILEGLKSGSVTGVINIKVNSDVWPVPNVVNRENYRLFLLSALTEDLPALDGKEVGEYLDYLEKGNCMDVLNNNWTYKLENMTPDNAAIGDHVAESPVVFLNELISL